MADQYWDSVTDIVIGGSIEEQRRRLIYQAVDELHFMHIRACVVLRLQRALREMQTARYSKDGE